MLPVPNPNKTSQKLNTVQCALSQQPGLNIEDEPALERSSLKRGAPVLSIPDNRGGADASSLRQQQPLRKRRRKGASTSERNISIGNTTQDAGWFSALAKAGEVQQRKGSSSFLMMNGEMAMDMSLIKDFAQDPRAASLDRAQGGVVEESHGCLGGTLSGGEMGPGTMDNPTAMNDTLELNLLGHRMCEADGVTVQLAELNSAELFTMDAARGMNLESVDVDIEIQAIFTDEECSELSGNCKGSSGQMMIQEGKAVLSPPTMQMMMRMVETDCHATGPDSLFDEFLEELRDTGAVVVSPRLEDLRDTGAVVVSPRSEDLRDTGAVVVSPRLEL